MYPLRDFQRPPERFKISRILVTDMVVLSYAIQIRTLTHLFTNETFIVSYFETLLFHPCVLFELIKHLEAG